MIFTVESCWLLIAVQSAKQDRSCFFSGTFVELCTLCMCKLQLFPLLVTSGQPVKCFVESKMPQKPLAMRAYFVSICREAGGTMFAVWILNVCFSRRKSFKESLIRVSSREKCKSAAGRRRPAFAFCLLFHLPFFQ